ncbi:hypothetical protein GCM10009660_02240 [Catellatospora bangladeshensis]
MDPLRVVVLDESGAVAERDVVDVEQGLVLALLVPHLLVGVAGVGQDGAHRALGPGHTAAVPVACRVGRGRAQDPFRRQRWAMANTPNPVRYSRKIRCVGLGVRIDRPAHLRHPQPDPVVHEQREGEPELVAVERPLRLSDQHGVEPAILRNNRSRASAVPGVSTGGSSGTTTRTGCSVTTPSSDWRALLRTARAARNHVVGIRLVNLEHGVKKSELSGVLRSLRQLVRSCSTTDGVVVWPVVRWGWSGE